MGTGARMTTLIPKASLVPGSVPLEEHQPLWRQSISAFFDSQPVNDLGPEDPQSVIHQYHLERALFLDTSFEGQHFRRDPSWMARNDDADHLMLQFFSRGSNQVRNGTTEYVEQADNIYAVNLAYEIEAKSTASDVLLLVLPRNVVQEDLPYLTDKCGGVFAAGSTSAQVFADHMQSLQKRLSGASAAEAPRILQSTMGLLDSLARSNDVASSSAQDATLKTICRYIDRNLSDPELGVDGICAYFRCSRATLYRVFQSLGGVREHIQRRRLTACFRAIVSPGMGHRRIFDIAMDYGFVSPSHFSHLFRSHFGMTPREARDAGMERPQASMPDLAPTAGRSASEDAELMWRWGKTLATVAEQAEAL